MMPVIVIKHTDIHHDSAIMHSSSSVHLYLEEHRAGHLTSLSERLEVTFQLPLAVCLLNIC